MKDPICPVCNTPVSVTQCGYTITGHAGEVRMHVRCGESKMDAYELSHNGASELSLTLDEATTSLCINVEEGEYDESYTVRKIQISAGKYYSLAEFQGF